MGKSGGIVEQLQEKEKQKWELNARQNKAEGRQTSAWKDNCNFIEFFEQAGI